jgi:hypothetical protein
MPKLPKGLERIIITYLGLDEQLAFEFFIVFSRFEYALKLIPSCRTCKEDHVEADWNAFARRLQESHSDIVIKKIADYLLKMPPQRQICKDNVLDWGTIALVSDGGRAHCITAFI